LYPPIEKRKTDKKQIIFLLPEEIVDAKQGPIHQRQAQDLPAILESDENERQIQGAGRLISRFAGRRAQPEI